MPHHPAQIAIWISTWLLCGLVFFLILWRPRRIPEYVWAVAGAVLLVLFRLLPLRAAWMAIRSGTDVYLFLAGMMILAELARNHGVFDWLGSRSHRSGEGISDATVCAGVRHRHRSHGTPVQRCDGCPADSGCAGGCSPRKNFSAALPVRLRLHRQRRQLRPADLESGESGRLRRATARTRRVATNLLVAIGGRDRNDVPRVVVAQSKRLTSTNS